MRRALPRSRLPSFPLTAFAFAMATLIFAGQGTKVETATQRASLARQVKELIAQRKLPEAQRAAEKLLAFDSETDGACAESVLESLHNLETIFDKSGDDGSRLQTIQRIIDCSSALRGEEHWRTREARVMQREIAQRMELGPEAKIDLKEAKAAFKELIKHYRASQYAEALAAGERALSIHRELLGEEHTETATSYNNTAFILEYLSRYDESLDRYRKAIFAREKTLGDHPKLAGAHSNMGALYYRMGKNEQALSSYLEARRIFEKTVGLNHPTTASLHNNLGSLYRRLDRFSEARDCLQRGLSIQEAKTGENSRRALKIRSNIAELLRGEGNLLESLDEYQKIYALQKEILPSEHRDFAVTLSAIGHIRLKRDEFELARQCYEESKRIYIKAVGADHPSVAALDHQLGTIAKDLGNFARAMELYKEAHATFLRVYKEDHPETARSHHNIGKLYQLMGLYDQAILEQEISLAIRVRTVGAEKLETAYSYEALGVVHTLTGNYADADENLHHALKIRRKLLEPESLPIATSLEDLATLYSRKGEHAEAETRLVTALRIRRKLSSNSSGTAYILNALGVARMNLGKHKKARDCFEESRNIYSHLAGEDDSRFAVVLGNLADLADREGNKEEAERLFQATESILSRSLGPKHPLMASQLMIHAQFLARSGRHSESHELHLRCLAAYRDLADLVASTQMEYQQIETARLLRGALDSLISLSTRADLSTDDVYEQVLLVKGSVLARQIARAPTQDADMASAFEEQRKVTRRIATISYQPTTSTLRSESRKLEKRRKELNRRFSDWTRTDKIRVRARDVALALPDSSALIDYVICSSEKKDSPELFAFVLRADRPTRQFRLGPIDPISKSIIAWRRKLGVEGTLQAGKDETSRLKAGDQLRAFASPGADLKSRLWTPLEAELSGIDTVLVSPDGVLGLLPFAALPGKTAGGYLIEDRAMAIVPAPRLMVARSSLATSAQGLVRPQLGLLTVGPVDYDSRPSDDCPARELKAIPVPPPVLALAMRSSLSSRNRAHYGDLPFAAVETSSIAKLFRSRFPDAALQSLTEDCASEDMFSRWASTATYIHIATHGFFSGGKGTIRHPGLSSGIALAGANLEPGIEGDGILTALEASAMDLRGTKLIVLSACDTGLGVVAKGEGLLGLQRTFQAAGAESVLASLWKVSDKPASRMMQLFYENLWTRGLPMIDALAAAQRQMIREPTRLVGGRDRGPGGTKKIKPANASLRGHPINWAAWVLSGGWN